MIEQSGPPSKEILTLKQVQEFLKDGEDVIIIGVFKERVTQPTSSTRMLLTT